MAVQFVPFSEEYAGAAQRFNQRMREGNAPTDFLLPEQAASGRNSSEAIRWQHYVAADGKEVRGGVLEMDQPGWLDGREVRAVNFQSPLSEGIADGNSLMVGMQLVKFMQKRSEAAFVVGMGAASNPLPRLLKAAGWSVREIPFFFRVHRASVFLRQVRPLQTTMARRLAARLAAISGLGTLALAYKQRARTQTRLTTHVEKKWGDWADDVWQRVQADYSFCVQRNRDSLESLYDANDPRISILRMEQSGQTVGWAVCLQTQMKDNRYFGDMRVTSILDCVATSGEIPAVAVAADREAGRLGADLVLVNHSFAAWGNAFRDAGFLSRPSNFLLAMSKPLTTAIVSSAKGEAGIHITRGDGDGRINL